MLEIARTFQQNVVEKRLTPHFFCLGMLSSKKYSLVHPVGNIFIEVTTLWSKQRQDVSMTSNLTEMFFYIVLEILNCKKMNREKMSKV